ncbi:MAG: type III pantothenate kinase [Eubacterium sp.]|jgi:type III pantothenate kinase
MLLAFDIGNTEITVGLFSAGKLLTHWRLQTASERSADEYAMIVNHLFTYEGYSFDEIDDVIISSVVPSVLHTFRDLSEKYFGISALVVESGIKTGLIIKYDNPKQVGGDQIVNAVAAVNKYGGPLIVVDLGTATTVGAIDGKDEYLGGTVTPGLKISSDALFEKTAMLPKVELDAPGKIICSNTVESMQAGIIYGHVGMIEYIVAKMKEEMKANGAEGPIKVIATGVFADMMMEAGLSCIDHVDEFLTLDGLEIIYEKNIKERKPASGKHVWEKNFKI